MYTNKETLDGIKKQYKKRSDCMNPHGKQEYYKDKFFSVATIVKVERRKAQEMLGPKCIRYRHEYTEKEIIEGVKKQLKRHPGCMRSHVHWDSYKDKMFSSTIIVRFGWRKTKELVGLKCQKRNISNQEIIVGLKKQFKKYPRCMDSRSKWDRHQDKPYGGDVLLRFGWKRTKEIVGLRYRKRDHTEKEIIRIVRNQYYKHPNSMISCKKWDSYKDKPFTSDVLYRFGWKRAKEIVGLKCLRRNYSDKEIFDGIKRQYQKHPNCMSNPDNWDAHNDKPFSLRIIKQFGWEKAKILLELPIYMTSSVEILAPLLIKRQSDKVWLSDVLELLSITCHKDTYGTYRYRQTLWRKIHECILNTRKFTKDDIKLAKKCFINLASAWKQKNTIRRVA